MRYRRDADERSAAVTANGEHDNAGTVFRPFLLPALLLIKPEIRIANDEARNRIGQRHLFAPPLGATNFMIESSGLSRGLGRQQSLNCLPAHLPGAKRPTIKLLQALIFSGR